MALTFRGLRRSFEASEEAVRTEGETTYWLNPSNRFDPTAECPYCNAWPLGLEPL